MLTPTITETCRHGHSAARAHFVLQASVTPQSHGARGRSLDDRPIVTVGSRYGVGRRAGTTRAWADAT
jgi:hypothetical protein